MLQRTYTVTDIFNKATNWYFNLKPLQQFVVLAGVVIVLAELAPKNYSYYQPKPKPIPRNDFTDTTQKDTAIKQGNACNSCKEATDYMEFHHIDGDRSNNRPSNCEGLCPACHAIKTRKVKRFSDRFSQAKPFFPRN